MKLRMVAFTLTLIVGISLFSISCRKEEWEGNIFKEGEISVVENRGEGIWGKKIKEKIFFEETLSLGVEEGPDYLMFGAEIDIAVDSDQSIYILDWMNYRLLKFDKEGRFLWEAGRKGQGPGEFERASRVRITPDGRAMVFESPLIHLFAPDGRFLNTIRLEKPFSEGDILKDGRIFINNLLKGQAGFTAEYYSKEGKFLRKFPDDYSYGPKFSPGVGVGAGSGFTVSKDKIYLCLTDIYEIREYNLEGRCLRKIRRDLKLKPPEIEVDSEGSVRMTIWDLTGPAFTFRNGMIVNNLKIIKGAGEKYHRLKFLDLFNQKGQFLGSYPLSENEYLHMIDKEDNFYFVYEYPFVKIVRKKVKII